MQSDRPAHRLRLSLSLRFDRLESREATNNLAALGEIALQALTSFQPATIGAVHGMQGNGPNAVKNLTKVRQRMVTLLSGTGNAGAATAQSPSTVSTSSQGTTQPLQVQLAPTALPGPDWSPLSLSAAPQANQITITPPISNAGEHTSGAGPQPSKTYGGMAAPVAAPAQAPNQPTSSGSTTAPVLTLGGAGSNGILNPTGGGHGVSPDGASPPTVGVQDLNTSDWVGEKGGVQAVLNRPGHSAKSISWTYSGTSGVYYTQQIVTTNGLSTFNNVNFSQTNPFTPASFYYGFAGTETFTATVTWDDNTISEGSLTVDVQNPGPEVTLGGIVKTNPNAVPGNPDDNGNVLQLGTGDSPETSTVSWSVDIQPCLWTGEMAVMQTITSATNQYVDAFNSTYSCLSKPVTNNGVTTIQNAKFSLLDPGQGLWYGNTGEFSLSADDTPHSAAPLTADISTLKANVLDTLMLQGPDGIWIPDQSWTWSENISATRNNAGAWVPVNNGTSVNGPNATESYPTWGDPASNWTVYYKVS